jgi:hypothetical protein
VVLYEMLSGAPPYRGSLPEIIVQQAAERRRELEPAGGLEAIAEELLSTEPRERPKSALQLIEKIEGLGPLPEDKRSKRSPESTRVQRVRRPTVARSPWPRAMRWGWIAGGLVAATLLSFAFLVGRPVKSGAIETAVMKPAKAVALGIERAESQVTSAAKEWNAEDTKVEEKKDDDRTPATAAPINAAASADRASAKLRSIASLEATIDRSLARRGLSIRDVAGHGAISVLVARWEKAKRAKDIDDANAAAAALVAEIAKIKIDAALVRVKLNRLNGALGHARRLPARKLASMKDQYRTLRNAVEKRNPTDAECRALALRVAQLENQLAYAMHDAGFRG